MMREERRERKRGEEHCDLLFFCILSLPDRVRYILLRRWEYSLVTILLTSSVLDSSSMYLLRF